jgi:DNA helicase-2/ATP-dependent DNA helicase PcrA
MSFASAYPSPARFLTALTLDPPDAASDPAGKHHMILPTIHFAKSQECAGADAIKI